MNNVGRGLLGHATYQISKLWALWFQTRRFSHDSLCKPNNKTCVPQGWYNFWATGDNLNKIGRGLLGDATYQISKL